MLWLVNHAAISGVGMAGEGDGAPLKMHAMSAKQALLLYSLINQTMAHDEALVTFVVEI